MGEGGGVKKAMLIMMMVVSGSEGERECVCV